MASNLRYHHPLVFQIETSPGEAGTVLRLVGRLATDGVQELERACRDVESPLILNLSELRHVDDSGLAALRELVSRGAELVAIPPYIALLLERP